MCLMVQGYKFLPFQGAKALSSQYIYRDHKVF